MRPGSKARPGSARAGVALAGVFSFVALVALVAVGCGETRRPIGDECLRGEDCLSGVCSERTCVAAPNRFVGGSDSPPDEEPRIPAPDAAPDAAGGG